MTTLACTVPHPLECLHIACSTVCNLKCCFCARGVSTIPRATMSPSTFATVVEKATAFGYETFNLTPLVGEPLSDPDFSHKLAHLEQHPGVHDFYFCTNLILADGDFVAGLAGLSRLRCFSVSIYGHDPQSFSALTEGPSQAYQQLLENLCLLRSYPQLVRRTEFRIRTSGRFRLEAEDSELCDVLRQLSGLGGRIRIPSQYQNWGGLIKTSRLGGLALDFKPIVKPREPCVFLFFKPTVLPSGDLTACSSGDGNAAFVIGDLLKQGFEDIYSTTNARYSTLLSEQRAGHFRPPCRACTGYRSIKDTWYSYAYHRKPFVALSDFDRWLGGQLDLTGRS